MTDDAQTPSPILDRLPDSRLLAAIAAVGPFAVAGMLVALRGTLSATNLALLLVVTVVAVAASGVRWAGAVAAASATVGFDFFLTHPYYSLTISNRDDVETAIILLVVGLAVAELAHRGRSARTVAEERHADLERLQRLSATGGTVHHPTAVGDALAGELLELLPLAACRYEPVRKGRHLPTLRLDGTIETGTTLTTVATDGFPRDNVEIEVSGGGRFVLVPLLGEPVDAHKLLVATTLVDRFSAMIVPG